MKYRLLLLLACNFSAVAQEPAGQYPFTSTRMVTKEDLRVIDPGDLVIMRNEVFARHGYIFKNEDLKRHFGSQDWYKPIVTNAVTLLSELEKKNVAFIKKYEDHIAIISDFNKFYNLFMQAAMAEDADKLAELANFEGGLFSSVETFKDTFMSERVEIQEAIDKSSPVGDANTKRIRYGEFYQGVQYKWVEFRKENCCWYIFGFLKAG